MAIEKTISIKADMDEALKKLLELKEDVEEVDDTTKKTEKSAKSLADGFSGVGLAMKAAGFGLIMKLVDNLTAAMMKNEQIADGVEIVFNSIGVVFKLLTDTIINVYTAIAQSSENFDALGRVAKNVLDIALTPFKLAFDGIKLGVQSLQLVWEKSIFGGKGKDVERIAELTTNIENTKQSIKDTKDALIESGKEIVGDFTEAVGEITTIATVAQNEFKKTFEDVTVNSIIEQGKAITETKKNYELLALQQQRLIEQYDIEAESQRAIRDDVSRDIAERIEANEELGRVLKEQNTAEQSAVDAQIASLKQRIELEGTSVELTNEIFALETEKIAIQAKVKGFEAEQLTNINSLLQEQTDLNNTLAEQEAEKVAIVTNSMSQIASALGENSKAGKALAIASSIIDTYQAANKALAQGGIFGTVAAAGIVATGLSNVKKISSTSLPGVSGDGGGAGLADVDLPTGIGAGGLIPNLEGIDAVELGGTAPVQAFVVENDISNAQALQEELEIQATL